MGSTKEPAAKPAKQKKNTTQGKPQPKRDDFTPTTIRALKDAAGNICSKPDCLVFTAGSKELNDGPMSIGIAAHITAAAPGGPRYDGTLTKEERRAVSNGIWLCQNHARQIDVDPVPFPVELLKKWKAKAEQRSNAMVGQKSITEAELRDEIRKESGLSLERFIRRDLNPVQTPVGDIMSGYEQSLSSLDPRFNVKVMANGKAISHEITAASADAKFNLVFSNIHEIEGFVESANAFFEEGREFTIHSPNFSFKGSQLFESIHDNLESGKITLGGNKRLIKTNIYVVDNEGHEFFIDSFESHSTHGQKRLIAEGKGLGGFFRINYCLEFDTTLNKLDLTCGLSGWKGKDILKLPYFARLVKSIPYLNGGNFIVEYEFGNEVIRFNAKNNPSIDDFVDHYTWLVSVMQKARSIAEKLDKPIILKEFDLSADLQRIINKYAALMDGNVFGTRKPGLICEGEFDFYDDYSHEDFDPQSKVSELKYTEHEGLEFNLFGQIVKAPRVVTDVRPTESLIYCPLDERDKLKVIVNALEESNSFIFG
ncbi:hypothetical protein [Pseudomonas cavernicola]|nr:hypothetical protein [Pseudomonas cavernicola]